MFGQRCPRALLLLLVERTDYGCNGSAAAALYHETEGNKSAPAAASIAAAFSFGWDMEGRKEARETMMTKNIGSLRRRDPNWSSGGFQFLTRTHPSGHPALSRQTTSAPAAIGILPHKSGDI